MDAIAALDRSYELMIDVLGRVEREQFDTRTPCGDWDVRGVLNHTLWEIRMITDVNEGRLFDEVVPDLSGDDVRHALIDLRPRNMASWRLPGAREHEKLYPFGIFTATDALMINVGEVAVHGWDVAKATAQETTMDSGVVELLYAFYRRIPLNQYRANGVFGDAVAVAPDAPVSEQMLGLIGRQS